jgi:hypothetical protein
LKGGTARNALPREARASDRPAGRSRGRRLATALAEIAQAELKVEFCAAWTKA